MDDMPEVTRWSEVKVYDTTLRDGTQGEDISFSVEDKLRITQRLDELGVHYIEGGWPGSNPRDAQYFREAEKISLDSAKIVAFGSTCRKGVPPEKDINTRALLEARTEAITIFGKSWDMHALTAMDISLNENLELIAKTIAFLKKHVAEVIYDAEHFFDGFKGNREYALATIKAAQESGADCIVLCDTNGGTMPFTLAEIIREVQGMITTPLGIHCHNDADLAVANTIMAVKEGVRQVQGTINGLGERSGNANLCSIIPNLQLKMGMQCLTDERLKRLKEVSRFVSELANLPHNKHQPYVGDSAFAHKAGVHVSAIRKSPLTYEHVRPELVGNTQRILISDLSGESNVLAKAEEFKIKLQKGDAATKRVLASLKELENQGYQFEGAEGSFELLIKKAVGRHKRFFDLLGFRVIVEKRGDESPPLSEATIMVKVGDEVEHTAAEGNGPVNALDNALRKALEKFYPELRDVRLIDYKVRVLSAQEGTGANTRVLIESRDRQDKWGTVGVSENIIEASWRALVDSIDYKLLKEEEDGVL
jgi:2-isopropylmalate synthase